MNISNIRYIVFDVFGTVVDWHGSIVAAGEQLERKYDLAVDWHALANSWRIDGYFEAVFATAEGRRAYEPIDNILSDYFKNVLIPTYHLERFSAEDIEGLVNVWHRLKPWEDVLDGLLRLQKKYAIGPFTNGDFDLMIDMKRNASLPWDFITTGDIFGRYKPDPQIYIDEMELLRAKPGEIAMVAAHPFDMDNAKVAGYTTIFIPRPLEYGPNYLHIEPEGKQPVDSVCADFRELAELLEA